MKNRKAVGPDDTRVEVWKRLKERVVEFSDKSVQHDLGQRQDA